MVTPKAQKAALAHLREAHQMSERVPVGSLVRLVRPCAIGQGPARTKRSWSRYQRSQGASGALATGS
jgi:hypothetical protein